MTLRGLQLRSSQTIFEANRIRSKRRHRRSSNRHRLRSLRRIIKVLFKSTAYDRDRSRIRGQWFSPSWPYFFYTFFWNKTQILCINCYIKKEMRDIKAKILTTYCANKKIAVTSTSNSRSLQTAE